MKSQSNIQERPVTLNTYASRSQFPLSIKLKLLVCCIEAFHSGFIGFADALELQRH
jgi:hypothetical protein